MSRTLALLHAVAAILLLVLLVELAQRIAFPWDFLIRFESGFMTDMLKLHNGRPLFGPPTDLNTTVYAPMQELLTYSLLRPLGRDLDVRCCRLVAVALGFAAAATAACITAGGRARWLAFAVATLVVFRTFTADAPHPGHLHALHALALFVLCERAGARRSIALAGAAMAVAGVGPLVSIDAALAPVGAAFALVGARRGWGRALLLPIAVGALAWAASAGLVLRSPDARAFVTLLFAHRFGPGRLWNFLLLLRGHLLLLAVLAVPCALTLRRDGDDTRRFLRIWLAIGVAEVLPGLAAYPFRVTDVDVFGIVGLWGFLVVWPCLAGHQATRPPGVLATTVIALLVLVLVPQRIPPTSATYRYAERLDEAIASDVAAGRRVLLAHGTMPLVHAGVTGVPRDRADAISMSGLVRPHDLTGMTIRLRTGSYDRIYANSPGYALIPDVKRQYKQIGAIKGPPVFLYALDMAAYYAGYSEHALGWDVTMPEVTVLERLH